MTNVKIFIALALARGPQIRKELDTFKKKTVKLPLSSHTQKNEIRKIQNLF
jgi:hypothetical protein